MTLLTDKPVLQLITQSQVFLFLLLGEVFQSGYKGWWMEGLFRFVTDPASI